VFFGWKWGKPSSGLEQARMKFLLFLFVLLSLAGCGSDNNDFSTQAQTVRVGVIAPLEAGLTQFGRGIRNSVQLAVEQANASGRFPGYRFEVDARNDSSDPNVGRAAAQSMVTDPLLAGVVGTYNSGVAAEVAPVLQSAGVVMISPGNTDPALTRPVRRFANYFRLVVPDTIQGSVLASHAYNILNVRNVALVSEDKEVSLALVDSFASSFTSLGGTITIRAVVPEGTTDYTAVTTNVLASNPELVVYGGEFATAAPFRQQSFAQGLTVPLMGSDGIKDQAYITGAGAASNGDFASSVGAPIASQPGGAQFLANYQAREFAEPPSDFGPYAYDAANLIIEAVGRRGLDRSAIVADVQAANTTGVTGPISFDTFGDTLNRVLTIYRVQGGVFAPQTTVQVP
jgi:branched-chain amino acid transport system substrate-binding protein